MNVSEDAVTAAWVARQVGVGRAAVANWRKRYPDFPKPIESGTGGPLFSWAAVRQWLQETGKAEQLSLAGRTGTGAQRIGDASSQEDLRDRDLSALPPAELLARALVALLPRLGDGDPVDDDVEPPFVLDTACRDATLLAAVTERFADHVRLAGQVPSEAAADKLRHALGGAEVDLRVGDALVNDRFGGRRGAARAVLCIPPGVRHWPAHELAADPRWRFGLPDPADSELAWVQHCVAHLRPRGVAVVVVSPITGVRQGGRHVREALVRAGVLRDVIALPATLTPSGEGAVHVWVLQAGGSRPGVRMVDLTGLGDVRDVPSAPAGWDALFAVHDPNVVVDVPLADLLEGDVWLLPARYITDRSDGSAAELEAFARRLARLYADVGQSLRLPITTPGPERGIQVTLAELERSRALVIMSRDATPRAGDVLFRTMGRPPVVATGTASDEGGVAQVVAVDPQRLDPHFVAQFVRADALAAPVVNTHAALTRDDVRRCRIPRISLAEQRRYGNAFRRLEELDTLAERLARVTRAVAAEAVHSLATGALSPEQVTVRESIVPQIDEKAKATT